MIKYQHGKGDVVFPNVLNEKRGFYLAVFDIY